MNCPYCNGLMKASRSLVVYRDRGFRKIYLCENWPACDSCVGCHKRSGEPLGTPANWKLRKLRKTVHAALDPHWLNSDNRRKARTRVYRWLAKELEVTKDDCHVAMFDEQLCKNAIVILTR